MERLLLGLTPTDVRRLAFELAEKLGISIESCGQEGSEGMAPMFPQSPAGVVNEEADAASLTQAVGFNRAQVDHTVPLSWGVPRHFDQLNTPYLSLLPIFRFRGYLGTWFQL